MTDMAEQTKAYVRHVLAITRLTPTALAKKANMPSTTLTRPLNRPDHKFALSNTTLQKIADATGITFASFARRAENLPPGEGAPELSYHPLEDETWHPRPETDGEGYDRESYSPKLAGAIPELDAKAGAGEGAVGEVMVLPMGDGTISAHKILDEWLLPAAYLREAVRNPNQAIVMSIEGDSMTPNYMPGDRVIIDLSQDRLEADGVYLISYDYRHPQVKRLQSVPLSMPPRVLIISDNASYQPFEVEVDLLRIHGKVCAYVGRR